MKVIITALIVLALCVPVSAQEPWCDAKCKVSIAVYAAGSAFDLAASATMPRSFIEGNPLATGKDKKFSPWRGITLKTVPLGASLAMQRNHPRAMFWFRMVAGAGFAGAGAYNLTITHRW
jgi:hypothetical protein